MVTHICAILTAATGLGDPQGMVTHICAILTAATGLGDPQGMVTHICAILTAATGLGDPHMMWFTVLLRIYSTEKSRSHCGSVAY